MRQICDNTGMKIIKCVRACPQGLIAVLGNTTVVKGLSFGCALCAVLLLAGCANRAGGNDASGDDVRHLDPAHVDRLNNAGLELLAECSAKNRGMPVLISPFSIDSAFALLWLGSSNVVQSEISNVLGFSDGVGDVAAASRMLSRMSEPRILTSSSLWLDKEFPIADSYLNLVNRYFPSSVFEFDNTRPKEAARAINRHVAKNTQGNIHDLLSPGNINEETKLILLNTMYFKGRWKSSFDKKLTIKKYKFDSLDGSVADVEMMQDAREARYREEKDYQALALPYKGSGQSCTFFAVLPRRGYNVDALIKKLARENKFSTLYRSGCAMTKVSIKLPKLDFSHRTSLRDALKSRGMTTPFVACRSSFPAITEGKNDVYVDRVSDVIHEARIKMDEDGTEAAAATAIEVCEYKCYICPPEFTADHPFLAFVVDDRSGLILFAAVVRNLGAD